MIDAAQCLARSNSLYELARTCPTEMLRTEKRAIAIYWKRLSITAVYQDQIDSDHATREYELTAL
jgi:hypothetical protein